jgi:hypothetical protein
VREFALLLTPLEWGMVYRLSSLTHPARKVTGRRLDFYVAAADDEDVYFFRC